MPTPGILLADHFRSAYGYHGHRARGTKDWLMIYTVAGEGSFRVNREIRVCKEGDVAILAPGVPHHYATNPGVVWDILWVHFLPLPEWQAWLQLPRTEERLVWMNVQEKPVRQRIEQAFERLIHDARRNGKADQELATLALAEILLLLHQAHDRQAAASQLDERIAAVAQHLAGHLGEKHRLADLARLAGLSESRFCHLFKEETGEPYTAYLLNLRLQKAAKLLEFTTRRVGEIAADVGFDSAFYLTRRFTERFGMSPSAFRKKAQRKWFARPSGPS